MNIRASICLCAVSNSKWMFLSLCVNNEYDPKTSHSISNAVSVY